MSFRARMLIAILLAVLLPAAALALLVRHETTDRLTAQYERRVDMRIRGVEEDLASHGEAIASSLRAVKTSVADDNRFRRAAVDRARNERRYLIDFATNAMQLAGLSTLQVQDESGRILSSGHFRNEYDRIDKELVDLLPLVTAAEAQLALVEARSPQGTFPAMVRADSFQMGGRRFYLVGGNRVDRSFLDRLVRGDDVSLTVTYPGGRLSSRRDEEELLRNPNDNDNGVRAGDTTGAAGADTRERMIVRAIDVPFIASGSNHVAAAEFRVEYDISELMDLQAGLDRWFLVVSIVAALVAVMLVIWLTGRISRPLEELAEKTSRIDLDRLNVSFKTKRRDEVGRLSRTMDAMTGRLRASAAAIKDAERRATLGELARQVNHDIKNGLTPIRNVFSHLSEVSDRRPTELADVFRERRSTLDSGISYLENLAGHYARLTPEREKTPCDVNAIIRRIVADLNATGHQNVRAVLSRRATVTGDALSVRRILDNLIDNAVESLRSPEDSVTVTTEQLVRQQDRRVVRITVSDTGVGMSEAQLVRAFDDFYTTKEKGTGLGLSIVRRLVMDLGGSMDVESEPELGTRFSIDLPEA